MEMKLLVGTRARRRGRRSVALALACLPALAACAHAGAVSSPVATDQSGLYLAFCPASATTSTSDARPARPPAPRALAALASHAGWPPDECLKMDKGRSGATHTLVGSPQVHNWLLGGHGIVRCDGPGLKTFVMRYLPQNRPWTLVGCAHKALVRYRA